ncbi:CDP-glycerol glycerophosphotransferase [Marinomonas ushuaiensis DSM 15871]|uniref:CDP-glycerol glycerophosphotransferase n=1 Tax=Marinomonas ushuaiensis DSM 15871 TaxID=1122207 RepID=X7E516_9GAMM|nr:CDP-glycerol glycerophosphotransferase family protein [Marinomonas ushuaiensis]ETX10935.1 CDP-glycerol glycerophosphotransferase [Marinomonas ushuaiensis DSM 15871]
MDVIFDTKSLYYLPQYLPVYNELCKLGIKSTFVFYDGVHNDVINKIISDEKLQHFWVKDEEKAAAYYEERKADWVFFSNTFHYLDRVHKVSKTAQMAHGIGPKTSYYTQSSRPMGVRFVEGAYRTQRLREMFPNDVFVDVGFCKLDPIFNGEISDISLSETYGLKDDFPTILYAPTFYPSSIECFPADWPAEFKDFNIIIKPHYFSLSKSKYYKQQALLKTWSEFDNVYLAKVEDYSLVPFLSISDVLVSDASSSLFEFALLNKPVIWCDFLKLRLGYRGIFSYRFKKRMDKDYGDYSNIAVHAKKYENLKSLIVQQLDNPEEFESIRLEMSEKLAGKVDGSASKRIVEYVMSNI